jgi:hypothetical protein
MHPHFTMTFPSFLFTTLTHPSQPHHSLLPFSSLPFPFPHFPSLHFTSLHFTSLLFTSFLMIALHLPFALFITFLTFSLKLLDSQERVPKTSAELDDPIYKGIFSDICLFLSAPNFPIMIEPVHIAWAL